MIFLNFNQAIFSSKLQRRYLPSNPEQSKYSGKCLHLSERGQPFSVEVKTRSLSKSIRASKKFSRHTKRRLGSYISRDLVKSKRIIPWQKPLFLTRKSQNLKSTEYKSQVRHLSRAIVRKASSKIQRKLLVYKSFASSRRPLTIPLKSLIAQTILCKKIVSFKNKGIKNDFQAFIK